MKKLILSLLVGLFTSTAMAADTLEVFAFLVQFKQEKTDNSLTTGDGTFGSDVKNKDAYSLDPVKMRNSASYWQKHFEFANNYFQAASGGKMAVKARIFPEASSGQTVYTLDKQIIDYNRTKKMKGEKTAEYDDARSRDYLSFIYDAVMKVHKSKNSPFEIPLPENPNTKRAYMIIHAGASRLVDGGSMGTDGADTPGDFMDIYVSNDAWEYLSPDSEFVAVKKLEKDSSMKKDSSVVTGLVLEKAAMDTLKTMMVVSETASQDGLNWGINGILVNQLGREMGMPNTYDVVKGISRLGYFDLMDFAGYSAGNGFMPALPNAWNRSYMGWSDVKVVRPTKGKSVSVDIAAAGSGLGTEIVKVPLSASEYLLIENRQRSWKKDGEISVVLGDASADSDTSMRSVVADSITYVFEDSICTDGKCKKNPHKAKGLILSLSSFDAGIPASGIAVWKVNEWYLRESLEYGIANYWGGDTLRDHQFGISLVEADGVLSIGKTFKNALGQDSYDYGSGTDLMPHKRYGKKGKFETVKTILPTGYANTKTTQGGYTGIKISVDVPEKARQEKTPNAFMGDSVINYAAPVIRVTVSVDDGSIEDSKFPRNVGLRTAVRGAVFVDNPEKEGEKLVVVGAEDGTLQVFDALGNALVEADTALSVSQISNKKQEEEVPLYRVGPSYGPLVGMASDSESVYSLHRHALVRTSLGSGIPSQTEIPFKAAGNLSAVDSAVAGPILDGAHLYFASKTAWWIVNLGEYPHRSMEGTFKTMKIQDMALCEGESNAATYAPFIVFVGEGGEFFYRKIVANHSRFDPSLTPNVLNDDYAQGTIGAKDKSFRVACTDLDRDGKTEAIVLGSRGSVASFKLDNRDDKKAKAEWVRNYTRGAAGASGLKDETSGMAIGDVNGDGYPEVVFLGDNLLYALDRFGMPLAGFPVKLSSGTPMIGFFSDPLVVDVNGDETPEILVPSSDGIVYAYTGKGKKVDGQFPLAAGDFGYDETYEPMSIFVTNAVASGKSGHPQLYAFHHTNATAFNLIKASKGAESAAAAWTLPAGGNDRTGFFDASKLSKVEKKEEKKEISEFFVYPNPVKGGVANARFEIGAAAKSATFELYDITGLCVYKKKMSDVAAGRNVFANLDLKAIGSDVYTARLKVDFKGGKTKQKLFRVGVVH